MPSRERVMALIAMVEQGKFVEAIQEFYTGDASVQDNGTACLDESSRSAWEHSIPTQGLVENYGPALIDRALLDALCRGLGVSFYDAVRRNLIGAGIFEGFDLGEFFEKLNFAKTIAARRTVGLVDPIASADQKLRVNDGLPETLEEVVTRYGHRWFKLKVGGDAKADVERLSAIASVLDRIPEPYYASLDCAGYASAAMPDWNSMRSMT